ncbi:MAG: lactate utilization protein, partial [Tetrasphaera sp.]|nr:lactate utilization protein [Tetrasphaera sp.]
MTRVPKQPTVAVARKRRTPAPPEETFLGMPAFRHGAKNALANTQQRRNLRHATGTIRAKRAAVVGEVADWEGLRRAGEDVKNDVLAHLDSYLVQFEEQFTKAGGTVHWASDADEANRIVTDLVRATGADEVVKVKS